MFWKNWFITEQWSPEGKKIYDRVFLLELRNNPTSQILPEKLINEEITRGSPVKVFLIFFLLFLLKLAFIIFYWVNFFTIYFEKEDVSNNSPERLIFPKISQPKVLFFSLLFQSFQVSHVYSWFNIFRNFQIKNLWSRTGLCVNYLKKTYANPKTVLSWGKRKTCIFPMESV
jgi:magnesium-transporting ATPase (P-type)